MDVLDLPWLVDPTADFRERVRQLSASDRSWRPSARALAAHRLSHSQLHLLGTAISRLADRDGDAVRLGVLSNGTSDLILPAIAASAMRHGEAVRTLGTAFGQVAPEALNPNSLVNRGRCDFILLCVDHRGLPLVPAVGDAQRARAAVDASLQYIDSVRRALHDASGCTVIVQTAPQVGSILFGSLERQVPGTLQWLIDEYNHELRQRVRESSDLLLDVAVLAETVGLDRWHDPVQWALGKFLFSHACVPLFADWVGRLIAAARGKARKCLVLDLDNTVWGGVIGDDGLRGIVLGRSDPIGEAYHKVQETALALRERGVILAVSSKNDEPVARNAFRSHPEMLLKEEHIAAFQVNWQDKPTNLKAIAKRLNIGIDTLVLLDDNPAERALVREALPTVSVPELPADPAHYAATLLNAGYFEAIQFTKEDRERADQYQANAARTARLETGIDLEAYLRSLRMRAIFCTFDAVGRARISQLINKTNQFNLTTRRYTESQVQQFEQSRSGLATQIRLTDLFGDNGVVSIVICVERGEDWHIDTWLMSCRVLGRRLEQATLNYIVARAKTAGVRTLIGEYIKTERNDMVRDHYLRLGFSPMCASEERSSWRLEIAAHDPVEVPIEVDEFAPPACAHSVPS